MTSIKMFVRISNVLYVILISFDYCFGNPSILAPPSIKNVNSKGDSKSEARKVKFNEKLLPVTFVTYGEHLKLICDVELSADMEVGWYMKGMELARSRSSELEIDKVDMEFRGQYITCGAIKLNDEVAQMFGGHISIDLGSPLKGNTKINQTVLAGNSITLSCKNDTTELPSPIKWHIKKLNAAYEDLNKTGDELLIANASISDAGEYKCYYSANCNCESSKTFVVTVLMAPIAKIEQEFNATHSYGDDVEISCLVEGYPLPKVVWKDSNGNQVVAKSTIVNAHSKISRLKINKIKVPNNYKCCAENEVGKAETSINITINSPFTVHEVPSKEIYVGNGKSKDIVCNITAKFPMEILWSDQNTLASVHHQIDKEDDFKISGANSNKLKIVSMKKHLAKKYTCTARLIADTDETKSFSFDVKFGDPAPPKITSKKLTLLEDSSAILLCKIEGGTPRPTLSWYFLPFGGSPMIDLNVTSEEFLLNKVSTSDAGIYQCIAKNPSGEAETLTEVEVRK